MMLNYKNGHQCLHFYIMNIVYAIEYHPYCPHTRVVVEEVRVQSACCGAPYRNCPISRFSTGATISISYNEELRVRQQLLGREGQ